MTLSRRKLLLGTTALAAVGGVWWWQDAGTHIIRSPSGLGVEVDLWLAASPTLLALGAQVPAATNPTELITRLRSDLALPAIGVVELQLLQQNASRAIARNFADDELEIVDGWLLASIEVKLGQLAALVSGGRSAAEVKEERPDWQTAEIAPVEHWGPQSTEVNQPFNTQSDGHCGMWFRIRGAPTWAVIVIDGQEMPTTVLDDVVTSGLFGELQVRMLANPGSYPIELVDKIRRVRQPIGDFVVTPRPQRWQREDGSESAVFCPVHEWGPNLTVAGEPPNPQPDGSSGLWFKLECAPPEAVVELNGTPLPSAVQPDLITTRVDAALYSQPGGHRLSLYDPVSGERMQIGLLRILPKLN